MKKLSIGELKKRVDPDPEVRQLRSQLKTFQSRVESLKLLVGSNDSLISDLKEAIVALPPQVVKSPPVSKNLKVSTPVSQVWHFTDWHIGEVVEANEIEDFNAFNYELACARIQHFVDTTVKMTEITRTSHSVPELVIVCSGDFISGDIHDELKVTNEWPVPVQCTKAGQLLAQTIMAAAPHFEKIRVEFIVPDNHSRLTKKVQFKESGLNSYNFIVGFIAKQLISAQSNVTFNIYPAHQQVVQVQNMRYLVQHGHGIKGTWGIPFYGIERVASQAAKARINKPDPKKFHKMLIGHFHAPLRQTWWQIGGSLTGTTELDHANNRYADPCQTMWLVHPKHGEFNYNEIWLGINDVTTINTSMSGLTTDGRRVVV